MRRPRLVLALLACAVALALPALLGTPQASSPGASSPDAGEEAGEEAATPTALGDGPLARPDAAEGVVEVSSGVSAQVSGYESDLPLEEEARRCLERYRKEGDCVVSRSGYLDLLGGTWGCVMQGDGWAEVLLVSEAPDGAGSEVVVWRMDAADAADALAGG